MPDHIELTIVLTPADMDDLRRGRKVFADASDQDYEVEVVPPVLTWWQKQWREEGVREAIIVFLLFGFLVAVTLWASNA